MDDLEHDSEAEVVAEDLLHRTGQAMLDGDYDAFSRCFALPFMLETVDGINNVTTDAEFRSAFFAVRDFLSESGVVDFVRTVMVSSFENKTTIASVHISSEIHAGGVLKRPAYPVYSTLKQFGTEWRITGCRYTILDSTAHNQALGGKVKVRCNSKN